MVAKEQYIPEGWSVKKIIDVCPLQRGFDLPEQNVIQGSFPIVYSNGIRGTHNQFKAKAPGVVTGRSGTIGKVTYVEENYWPHNTSLWVTDFKGNNPKFIFYKLSALNFTKFNSGSGVPTLNRNDVHVDRILVPPLPEQEKIVEILGVWDDGIEKLSKLVEEKKKLKKGMMQRLLTGNQRLYGFTEPWKKISLGEIFIIRKGKELSKKDTSCKGNKKCILYGELYTNYKEIIKNTMSFTDKNAGTVSKEGDILIPASTTTTGIDLAKASSVSEAGILLGGDINILSAKQKISSEFFAYALTHIYKYDIARITQGITIVHLYGVFLKHIKVLIPNTFEQKAIANILMTQDEEINLLAKKLEMLKQQKKGLMQQLLTGKTRVKVN